VKRPFILPLVLLFACTPSKVETPAGDDPADPDVATESTPDSASLSGLCGAVEQHRSTLEGLTEDGSFDARLEACEALGDRIGDLWAATRRAAIAEAKKRAVPREGETAEPMSRRVEDDLAVNFTTDGYAALAAVSYQLRWGGWREAGSAAVLDHLLTSTGVPLAGIRAACEPGAGKLDDTADCHAAAALWASEVAIERCP